MSIWAGPLHDLVELRFLSSMEESVEDSHEFTKGLSGRRRVRMAPQVSRSWSCSIDLAYPQELATLEEFYWAHRGRAVWAVSLPAAVQNVLPPPATELDRDRGVMAPRGWESAEDLTAAGAFTTEDGRAAASVLVASSGGSSSPVVPCLPGQPVTVSAYVGAGGAVSLVWVDSAGTETAGATSAAASSSGERVHVSVPTAEATACRLVVSGASVYARPQVTWTAAPVPYVVGKGASSVIFGPISESIKKALKGGGYNLSGYSYTISEVG